MARIEYRNAGRGSVGKYDLEVYLTAPFLEEGEGEGLYFSPRKFLSPTEKLKCWKREPMAESAAVNGSPMSPMCMSQRNVWINDRTS